MRRCLLALVSLASLLVCLWALRTWVRSYHLLQWSTWTLALPGESRWSFHSFELDSSCGRLYLCWVHQRTGDLDEISRLRSLPSGRHTVAFRDARVDPVYELLPDRFPFVHRWYFLKFEYQASADPTRQWFRRGVEMPLLFAAIMAGWLPALRGVLLVRAILRRRKRKRLGLCIHCGYDLRESADRCPECGRPILQSPHRAGLPHRNIVTPAAARNTPPGTGP